MDYYNYIKPILFKFDPETAHNIAMHLLKYNLLPANQVTVYDNLQQKIWDVVFDNPIGLSAGFDKNATAGVNLSRFGFGFVEFGTVTPKPQMGNPKPRLFRLDSDLAIINRLGFNSLGLEIFRKNLRELASKNLNMVLGANIGANKGVQRLVEDYLRGLEALYGLCNYFTINISSPNTPGLRMLQDKEPLNELLSALKEKRNQLAQDTGTYTPLVVKIAPDLTVKDVEHIAEILLMHNIDGAIVSNTTTGHKEKLLSEDKIQAGGLSGKPLLDISNRILSLLYKMTNGKIVIIGSGGITSGDDAFQKIKLGASLVQIYTTIIYNGFDCVGKINNRLHYLVSEAGFSNISEAIGTGNKD